MTKNDLDTAIEMCERIMECDTRTMQNPVSENGWIFDKVYDLLKFLRQFQFDANPKGGSTDTISRQAVITEFSNCELTPDGGIDVNYAIDFLKQMPPAQPWCEDAVSRAAVINALKQPGWIPVTERLPKPNEYDNDVRVYYLVQNEHGDMMVCSWHGSFWMQMYRNTHVEDKVVAWMELPTPYREGENEYDTTEGQ